MMQLWSTAIEWLGENKEWLFSGVGVSIVTLLFFFIRRFQSSRSSSGHSASNNSTTNSATNSHFAGIENLTATASDNGIAIISTGPVTINQDLLAAKALNQTIVRF